MIELEIDGKQIEVAEGATVIEAANKLGIYVPHFCYHKKLSIAANCRMCLVEVEKAPKPLPACATPATNGMKVRTHSALAVDAQKGVMEFLLINHPLDCPVCDEGGECQLQDLAVGYGASGSLYEETKRSVPNKFLGPLIATEMTRCIHCTRCVRFGVEIAGMMELGMAGRGEAAEILAFVGRTVNSELSGNMIDVCPVGALTSKPFRFTARAWELSNKKSVSPHCGLGSNLLVQTKLNRVYRVLPAENEEINECWLSDKDRFSYEGLNSNERLRQPMIKRDGEWKTCDWPQAFQFIASRLKTIIDKDGAHHIAALATVHQTLEELYLLQKLTRALGSGNVDFRLRQSDFTLDGALKGAPWLGMSVASLPELQRILLLGTHLRNDHPLIAARIRKAVKSGARVSVINPFDDDLAFPLAHKLIVAPSLMVEALEHVLDPRQQNQTARAIAASLREAQPSAILLGNLAQHHPRASRLLEIAQNLAQATGASFGFLGEAANSVGGYLAKATPVAAAPHGMNCAEMLRNPRRAYLLLGVEPELDCHDPGLAMAAMREAELVVAMSAYRHHAVDYAHVMLPIAPFSETGGTFVNTEGRAQSFAAAVSPLAETRPAWKVLRVLANSLKLAGFDYDTIEEIRAEIAEHEVSLNNALAASAQSERTGLQKTGVGIERIADVPIYFADAIVRRSPSLQETDDARAPTAMMNGSLIERLGLHEGQNARFTQGEGHAIALVSRDDSLPANCVRLACAHPLTSNLGPMFGAISVEPAS